MQYPEVDNEGRRIYSAMVTGMDMAVGQIVEALKENDLYDNSFLLFSSDVMMMIHCIKANLEWIWANLSPVQNGGQYSSEANGNNYPLRGEKNTLWEGGTRVPSFLHSPRLLQASTGAVYNG